MNELYEARFGANLKKLRVKKDLTQEQVSARLQILGCDVTRSALAKIEVGQRHIYPDEIALLQEILQVDFDEMFRF